jgi:hypothetical protein
MKVYSSLLNLVSCQYRGNTVLITLGFRQTTDITIQRPSGIDIHVGQ